MIQMGTILEVADNSGARRSAWVQKYCAPALVRPLRTSRTASAGVGQRKPNSNNTLWNAAIVAICHIRRVLADSVAVMPRTATVTLPYITALASANSAPI